MGKKWDYDVPSADIWRECLRVLKPGGHLLAFAGTRTQHRMACNIEDAGFDIRDMIAWVYGSGFPKSLDVSKAIDKAAGAEREVVGQRVYGDGHVQNNSGDAASGYGGGLTTEGEGVRSITAPATPEAQQWDGWGTALKPAMEPITVARKPLCGTVAENVLRHGTGGINVDGCRVDASDGRPLIQSRPDKALDETRHAYGSGLNGSKCVGATTQGRWPANLIHDGSDEVVGLFPNVKAGIAVRRNVGVSPNGLYSPGGTERDPKADMGYGDSGSAARFFYCAKASKRDREEGCADHAERRRSDARPNSPDMTGKFPDHDGRFRSGNHHPTVKPTALMRYLCRLVTPPGGTVLDPFMGSGSTGKAARLEGFRFIGIEREADYVEIAKARIQAAIQFPHE
jgi:site-specific DNA-methyltransferase (adenine-specific)